MTVRDLTLRARALFAPRRAERDLHDELAFHVERETQQLTDQGVAPEEARQRALARFGPVPLAADQCRDTRGISLVDDAVRDVFYALRTFQRAPLAAFTIVATVALGLGLVAVVFTLLNAFIFRVDPSVPNLHEMFAVERPQLDGDRPRFTRPQWEAMRAETSVFSDLYAELPDIDSRIEGNMMAGTLVTGNFFQVAGVGAAMGRTLTPDDDARFAPRPVMVLSYRGWDRVFAKDPSVIGRQLLVNGSPFEVVGVMPEKFRGLSVAAPDYWAPLSLVGQVRRIHAGREDVVGIEIIGRLKPGVSRKTALAALAVWDAGHAAAAGPVENRSRNIVLLPHQGTIHEPTEVMLVMSPLFFSFGLILLIGCANVANLLLARAVSRQREIGTRLSLGASRRRLVRQLLTESLLLALASAAVGYAISRLVLEVTIHTVLTSMPPDLGDIRLFAPAADWRVMLFLTAGAVVATGMFGFVPALLATRIEPVRAIRGEIIRDAQPGRARNLLIGLQVCASALLLICAAVFLRSAFAASTIDSGFRTSDTVAIEVVNEPMRGPMVQAVAAEPLLTQVAAVWPDLLSGPRAASAESGANKIAVAYALTSPEYFGVLDIPILRGRGFLPAERSADAAVAVVSDTAARSLWPNGNAVGQVLRLAPDSRPGPKQEDDPTPSARAFTVIGVARDVPGFRIARLNKAYVYVPADASVPKSGFIARVKGDPEQARRTLLDHLTLVDPNMGHIVTMRTMARMETYLLSVAFWLTFALGGLALVLTVSGLFSVLSYVVEQRKKEIGVRMALGATARDVARVVLSQSIRPVAGGMIAGAGMAGALALLLRASPIAEPIGEIVHVLDPVAYLGSLACIVAACALAAAVPARRASRVDPVETLRQD